MKVTRSGPRAYLQIIHAYRDRETSRPKQRHIANLGRADQFGESDLDTLINGLSATTAEQRVLFDGAEVLLPTMKRLKTAM